MVSKLVILEAGDANDFLFDLKFSSWQSEIYLQSTNHKVQINFLTVVSLWTCQFFHGVQIILQCYISLSLKCKLILTIPYFTNIILKRNYFTILGHFKHYFDTWSHLYGHQTHQIWICWVFFLSLKDKILEILAQNWRETPEFILYSTNLSWF